MVRTMIGLAAEEKEWLDREARRQGVSMAELVRRAVQQYRRRRGPDGPRDFEDTLQRTRGLWKQGDGLEYQREARAEWPTRS